MVSNRIYSSHLSSGLTESVDLVSFRYHRVTRFDIALRHDGYLCRCSEKGMKVVRNGCPLPGAGSFVDATHGDSR